MEYIVVIYEKDSNGKIFYTDITSHTTIHQVIKHVLNLGPRDYKVYICDDITKDVKESVSDASSDKEKENRRKKYLELKKEFEK